MKSVVAAVLCVLVTLEVASCHSEEDLKIMKDCAAENKVKLDDLKPLVEKKEISQDAKCFLKCMMISHEAMKEDGTQLDVAKPLKDAGHEELIAIAEDCWKIEKPDDLCEFAYQHALCMIKNDVDDKVKTGILEHMEEV